MSVQAIATVESQIIAKPKIVRRTANYKPSVWGDRFANYEADDTVINIDIYTCIMFISTHTHIFF